MTDPEQQTDQHRSPCHDPNHEDDEKTAPQSPIVKILNAITWFLKDQWFLLAMSLVILIASQIQVPLPHQATKQVTVSYLSVTIIFFTAGCTLDTRVLIQNYMKWKHHLFIQGQCFLLVSALAFGVVSLTATNKKFMDAWLLIGLIFNGCQPTAMASNVLFTRQSHGNVTLTVVQTTIGNLIGPLLSPALIQMYLSSGAWYTNVIPEQHTGYTGLYKRVFMQFGLSIYLPMFVGQVFRYFFPGVVQKVFVQWKLSKVGSLGMLTLLWQTFDHAFATGALGSGNVKTSNIVFIVFITVINYGVWLVTSFGLSVLWLDRRDTVSVAMTAPAKTLALGMPLSFLMFDDSVGAFEESKIQVPMVLFQVIQMGLASLLTMVLRRYVDAGENQRGAAGGHGGEGGIEVDHDVKGEEAKAGKGEETSDGEVIEVVVQQRKGTEKT